MAALSLRIRNLIGKILTLQVVSKSHTHRRVNRLIKISIRIGSVHLRKVKVAESLRSISNLGLMNRSIALFMSRHKSQIRPPTSPVPLNKFDISVLDNSSNFSRRFLQSDSIAVFPQWG